MAEDIKQTVLIDIDIEQDEGEFRKLAQLKGTLVDLKNQRNLLNDALKKELITQKEYNSEIVRVEALQKKVAAQYNQVQRSVTGLKNPFDKLNDSLKKQQQAIQGVIPGLDRITGGALSAAGGIFQMVKASLAFLATPLGLVIAGVTAALAPFATFLTQSGEGADLVTREMEGFRSVLQLVRDDLVKTGKEQKGFFEGLIESIAASNPVIGALVTQYNLLAEAGKKYADVLDDIQDEQENFSIQASKDENQVKRLILQAKNRTLTEQQRIDLLNKALLLEEGIVSKNTEFAQRSLSAIVERNRARLEEVGIIQKVGETQEDFVANNIDSIRDFDEALAKSLIDSVKKLEEAKSSGIAIEEKAQTQLDAIRQKAEEAEIKRQEAAFKRSEDERKQRIEDFDFKLEQDAAEFEAEVEKQEQNIEFQEAVNAKLDEMAEAFRQRNKEREEKRKKDALDTLLFEKQVFAARAGVAVQFGLLIQQLAGRSKAVAIAGVVIEKAAALGIIVAKTAEANLKAIAESPLTFGQPWVNINTASGILAGVATVAAAAEAITQINSAKGFARGGYTGRGGVWEPAGVVHKGEVVWSQADVERAGGPEVVDRMRPTYRRDLTPYAVGGIVGNETRIAAGRASSQIDLNQMAQLVNQIQTVLVLEEFEAKQNNVNQIQRRATVIG